MSKLLLSEQKEKNKKTKKVLTNIETNDIIEPSSYLELEQTLYQRV